jgi:hypothetical protein
VVLVYKEDALEIARRQKGLLLLAEFIAIAEG